MRTRRGGWFRWGGVLWIGVLSIILLWGAGAGWAAEQQYPPVTGQWEGMYWYDDGHAVHYSGALDRAGAMLSGTWRIGSYTGTWFAKRRN